MNAKSWILCVFLYPQVKYALILSLRWNCYSFFTFVTPVACFTLSKRYTHFDIQEWVTSNLKSIQALCRFKGHLLVRSNSYQTIEIEVMMWRLYCSKPIWSLKCQEVAHFTSEVKVALFYFGKDGTVLYSSHLFLAFFICF